MAQLLQAYTGASGAEAVELTIVDMRWQLVLNCLDADEPAFSQGSLVAFRTRLIAADMDRRLLERTVALASDTKAFDPKKLPKTLRAAVDSAPLQGAGRVEDTFNLLAHAARQVLKCAAMLAERDIEEVARGAGATLLVAKSVKAALDIDWSDERAQNTALRKLVRQLDLLEKWVHTNLPAEVETPPLKT
ncbi:MAG TPA: IS5/IS1182 family transposase, partial [Labilithrix sp.]|nr:IS5/IS1182 family transposase [Labilithrix sp.]